MSQHAGVQQKVSEYYSGKVSAHGPVPRGVDWNSAESQRLRFDQLLKLCDSSRPFTINDFGCGYGALASYMDELGFDFTYRGFDLSEHMLEHARALVTLPNATFTSTIADLAPADYTVASGIFSVKLDVPDERWLSYAYDTLDTMAAISTKGFAFNMLTDMVDSRRDDLYYADPSAIFEHCRRRFSRHVALLHDYPLWEFAIVVRLP